MQHSHVSSACSIKWFQIKVTSDDQYLITISDDLYGDDLEDSGQGGQGHQEGQGDRVRGGDTHHQERPRGEGRLSVCCWNKSQLK